MVTWDFFCKWCMLCWVGIGLDNSLYPIQCQTIIQMSDDQQDLTEWYSIIIQFDILYFHLFHMLSSEHVVHDFWLWLHYTPRNEV